MADMAPSFSGMVFDVTLWGKPVYTVMIQTSDNFLPGGGGIDMSWLDGMTGCDEACNLNSSSVTFTDFELLD